MINCPNVSSVGSVLETKSIKAESFATEGTSPNALRSLARYPLTLLPILSSSPDMIKSFAQ